MKWIAAFVLTAVSAFGVDATPELREIGYMLRQAGFEMEGLPPAKNCTTAFRVTAASQEYGQPTPDACCHTHTPLRIGEKDFTHGIGAHANGRITIELLRPAKTFKAAVGIDNNSDTLGQRGSAVFVIECDGEERFRSPVCHGGDAPVDVELSMAGIKRLDLVVEDAGDGISHDQADWAEATLIEENGDLVQLSEAFDIPLFSALPCSFLYDGKEAQELLASWPHSDTLLEAPENSIRFARTWTDPGTGFKARLQMIIRTAPPSLETQWSFHNEGATVSGLVSGVDSIDVRLPAHEGQVILHSCSGGLTGHLDGKPEPTGFETSQTALGEKILTVKGGRSSYGSLPFYYLTGLSEGWGLGLALGWSGQWRAEGRFDSPKGEMSFRAGMEPIHFRLPPGEEAALPIALFVPFKGQVSEGVNRMRRTLREHYQARLEGERFLAPVSFNSWFVFDNKVNAAMLKELADEAAPLGIEYFCLDAGWFDGDFPGGVGNWTIQQTKFPEGLKPVADHIHALGMKFGLWFEPERVADGTRWQREHPDWLLAGNLLDLGRPEARALVLDMMTTLIGDTGVDWIRYDFNIDPLTGWTSAEVEESQGLAQIRYINGYYAMMKDLMERFPNLLIEQCSSGGRRIDLRTIKYGHTFWKSDDTYDQPLMRFHETGGNQFILGSHLNTNYCRWHSEGELLALFAGPLGFGVDFRALSSEEKASLKKIVAAYKQIRHLLNEDYYPLFQTLKADRQAWCGWQFSDPETGEGCLIVYRPEESPYSRVSVKIQELSPERDYHIQDLLNGTESTVSGNTLEQGYEIDLAPGAARVCRYE